MKQRGHQADKQCVEQILNHGKYAYLGMIGSRLKVEKTLEALRESGFSENQI
ncbi:MAG: XdhC family protein, partial [Muribaculaceae bacterium]|nr:XdhC family protein [Muribaculaceae bacterium]